MTTEVTVEAVNEMVAAQFQGTPNRCAELGDEYALARYDVDQTALRPGGFISGPAQFGLADAALWYLVFTAVGRIEPKALTSELSIRYLRPAPGFGAVGEGDTRVGRPAQRGRHRPRVV